MRYDGLCRMGGCEYGNGGICRRCGDRLRCDVCGCFIRSDTYCDHVESAHPDIIETILEAVDGRE